MSGEGCVCSCGDNRSGDDLVGKDESDSDLLWAAIAGLRSDVARLVGRVERFAEATGPDTGKAEEAAEAWSKARREEIDRLLAARAVQGKGEELDEEDLEELERAWMRE